MDSSNPSSPAMSGGMSSASSAMLSERQVVNELWSKRYAAVLASLMMIFVLAYACSLLYRWFGVASSTSKLLSPFVAVTRVSRKFLLRAVPGFVSTGHSLLVTIYIVINVVFAFTGLDTSQLSNFAARFGWMAACNLALVVFLALKNTPLAFLTAYSYERINVLHRVAGCTTVTFMVMHASMYSAYFASTGKASILHEQIVTYGIVTGSAMFTTFLAAVILRRLNYEAFHIVHIAMFIVILVNLSMHRPGFDKSKIPIIVCLAAAMWGSDRILQIGRLLYNAINNSAKVYPLPDGGTRIVLRKPLAGASPGTHCYIWLPRVRPFETHPFTIVATSPLELIVDSHQGFTKTLHQYASNNPGSSLIVSVDGPYGKFPDPVDYDKVVLVAGGTGATFTFGMAYNMLERMSETSKNKIDFIWAVKTRDNVSWFTEHLNYLRVHRHAPHISLQVHITRLPKPRTLPLHVPLTTINPSLRAATLASTSSGEASPSSPSSPSEKEMEMFQNSEPTAKLVLSYDPEKSGMGWSSPSAYLGSAILDTRDVPFQQGRPDVAALVKDAIRSVAKDQRVLVAACGPESLMKLVRNTTAECIDTYGPGVELHCEQFGW